jgi:conjugative coupling factor TraD (SXT/TOL subfamily)
LILDKEEQAGRVSNWRARCQDWEARITTEKETAKRVPRGVQARRIDVQALVMLFEEEDLQVVRQQQGMLNGILGAVCYEQEFYKKIIASLAPFLEKLTSGEVGKLVCPGFPDEQDARPVFDWMQVIRQGGIVYIGLDALSDSVVASAVGNTKLADLVSVGGVLYKHGVSRHDDRHKPSMPEVALHVDEFNEICGPEFVPMVNKLRGSGFKITVYTQTLEDIEARTGNKAKAGQIIGNLNHAIVMRVRSMVTAKWLVDQLPEVQVNSLVQVSGASDKMGDASGADFLANNQDRVGEGKAALISVYDVMSQPRGQAFALIDGNRLHHIRIPLADSKNDPFIPESLKAVARLMKQKYRSSQTWAQETDWLADQGLFNARMVRIDEELAA